MNAWHGTMEYSTTVTTVTLMNAWHGTSEYSTQVTTVTLINAWHCCGLPLRVLDFKGHAVLIWGWECGFQFEPLYPVCILRLQLSVQSVTLFTLGNIKPFAIWVSGEWTYYMHGQLNKNPKTHYLSLKPSSQECLLTCITNTRLLACDMDGWMLVYSSETLIANGLLKWHDSHTY